MTDCLADTNRHFKCWRHYLLMSYAAENNAIFRFLILPLSIEVKMLSFINVFPRQISAASKCEDQSSIFLAKEKRIYIDLNVN